jgi:hypothetical protein
MARQPGLVLVPCARYNISVHTGKYTMLREPDRPLTSILDLSCVYIYCQLSQRTKSTDTHFRFALRTFNTPQRVQRLLVWFKARSVRFNSQFFESKRAIQSRVS